ncbi:unnamed protein product [Thelazia callipaeda]|uniref:Sulfhydryl oxidase n=1 Tax=Thelazia callipaeda TaxID=103827 RepID=A0A158RB23_THECL|nr:unnamed protein product [Thelazia callipaeda]
MIYLLILLTVFGRLTSCEVAIMRRQPMAINPTLYDSKVDMIIQLDEMTFNDTVFCRYPSSNASCTFYSDWCGHCRAYAETYKSLAQDIQGWDSVVQVAAINCADPLNEVTCRANEVLFFPLIKYFPRNSTDPRSGILLRPLPSIAEMRDQIIKSILYDYRMNHYSNWPNFNFLGNILTYSELWKATESSSPLLVIVFEENRESLIGAELLLDMSKYDDRLSAWRCLKNHSLVDALYIRNFPTLAVFKREQRTPLLVAELRKLLFTELKRFMFAEDSENHIEENIYNQSICDRNITECRKMYFVSETDILKALRYALVDEVSRSGKELFSSNLTALRDFLDLLAKSLKNSERAVKIFNEMRNYLDEIGISNIISTNDYKNKFTALEDQNNNPFPIHANWEHCAGSNPQFRGYTCGLWSIFHALTVQAYKNGLNDAKFLPQAALKVIRNWVQKFFGCHRCRDHFLQMTTLTFRMENHVHRPEDVFMYLWQAHNIVNARLRGRDTEDPKYPKRQFPAHFLCSSCKNQDQFDHDEVKKFLLNYYSAIRPYSQKTKIELDEEV